MVILYVITQGELGGAQLYIRELTKAARDKNWAVTVATGDNNQTWLSQEVTLLGGQGRQLKHLKRPFSPIHDILAIFELVKLYRKIKPDIIHLNSSKAGILGSLAFFVFKLTSRPITTKLFYTAHGWVFNEPMFWPLKTAYYLMEKITANLKDKIICVSEFDRQIAIDSRIADSAKLVAIHNGVDLNEKYFEDREFARQKLLSNNKFDSEKILIGLIANFYPTKGLNHLIDAVNIMIADYRLPITAVIIGDGELRPELTEQIKKLNLENNIVLTGQIKNAAQYLKAFDIAAMSSVKEGFPYFLLEAMAAGLPIVSTNVGGIPEIVVNEETGLLVEPKNSKQLAEKIKLLIDQPELRQKMGEAGQLRVKKEFNLSQMIDKTFFLYSIK